jgi:GNAT superfamily N-acetyltransferase
MSRRVHDLTPAGLSELPAACRACVFWEAAGARRGPASDPGAGAAAKDAWWQATQLEWGAPGKAVYSDGRLVAYAAFAPPQFVPRLRTLGHVVSDDALLLSTLWVDPAQRHSGLATLLLQTVLREATRRGARAVEACATRGHSGSCLLPEAFLLASGFTVVREHVAYPLLRMDLRQTARWSESIGHAVEGVISVLGRRERAPVPVPPA